MATLEQMIERQQVLADFGDFCLENDDLVGVLTEACRLVGKAMGTDLAKVLEIEHVENTLFVRAGVGWQAGVVGEVHLPMGEFSSETYAIEKAHPVLSSDIRHENRFEFPSFMKEAGVVGMINVPIYLTGRKPYGLLQVDSRNVWAPDDQDIAFLQTYATILGPVIDRLHKVHALTQSYNRNEILFQELQHRVKNNMAMIVGLVQMRVYRARTDEVRSELSIISERIEALRLAHEHIYASGDVDRILLEPYIRKLLENLLSLHHDTAPRLIMRIANVKLNSNAAMPIGLILNEFVTNSLKYAYPADFYGPKTPEIVVDVEQRQGGLSVQISDNGVGLTATRREPISSGTGIGLIAGLSKQIGAEIEWVTDNGTTLRMFIKYSTSADK